MTQSIPKIIHSVWLGSAEKPPLVQRCQDSWRRVCPDYELVEWNEKSLPKISNKYFEDAMSSREWAFASDYARLHILNVYGGVYLDTDTEMIRSIDDLICDYSFVIGSEHRAGKNIKVGTAFIAARKQDPIIQQLLREYETIRFVRPEGHDRTPNSERILHFFQKNNGLPSGLDANKTYNLAPSAVLFPEYYFSAAQGMRADTYAKHHFSGSWSHSVKKRALLTFGGWQISRLTSKSRENLDSAVARTNGLAASLPLWPRKNAILTLHRSAPKEGISKPGHTV